MSLVPNERIKLTAGLLNTVAGFSITAGGLAPLIAMTYGLNTATGLGPLVIGLILVVWLAAGVAIHLYARYLLGGLKP